MEQIKEVCHIDSHKPDFRLLHHPNDSRQLCLSGAQGQLRLKCGRVSSLYINNITLL